MKRTNKKGFTIVELVIVIAVIAILAAVLIPTFVSLTNKANLSADQQAVRQMNTALATYTEGVKTIADAKIKLSADNIDADNYKPLSKGHDFFWIPSLNKIILVNGEGTVVYPEDLKDKAAGLKDTWTSLSGTGNSAAVADVVKNAGDSGAVALTGTTNFQGASINLDVTKDLTIGGTKDAPATIQNFVSDEGSLVASNTGEYADNHYYAGLIKQVPAGKTVIVENLTIKGAVIGDTIKPDESARVGIIAGEVNGTLIIRNVTIEDCSVFGSYRIGALVGYLGTNGKVIIEDVTIKNTTVKGESLTAALIGEVYKANAAIKITNLETDNLVVSKLNTRDWNVTYEGNEYTVFDYGNDENHNYYAMPCITQNYFWVYQDMTVDATDATRGDYKQDVYVTKSESHNENLIPD